MRIFMHILALLVFACPGNAAQALTADSAVTVEPLQVIGKDIMCTPQLLAHSAADSITPALPAAGLLAIVGFACVSFVRDRAKWRAMIISSAMLANPHVVAARLADAFAYPCQVSAPTVACTRLLERNVFPQLAGTQISYLGLLYRLSGSERGFACGPFIMVGISPASCNRNGISTQFINPSLLLLSVDLEISRGPPKFYLRI